MSVKDLIERVRFLVHRATTGRGRIRRAELRLVRASALFDADWYIRKYPDVEAAGIDPLCHYMDKGWQEGRDPGPQFSTLAYLRANGDVGRSGTNPLIHFIEFGYAEGRDTFGHRPKPQDLPLVPFDFPEAAPCFSIDLPETDALQWIQHRKLDDSRSDFCGIGDHALGYVADADARARVVAAFECVEKLSGYAACGPASASGTLPCAEERLADAWYATSVQLRTRWSGGKSPFVVRAYQADPVAEGSISLIGEGVISSSLEVLDLHLNNSYFPVLILFAELDGSVRGARVLAFPSLCRGGVHYSELLYSYRGTDRLVDPLGLGEQLAGNLSDLLAGRDQPTVSQLSIELGGADGATPLFQPDFRIWLEKVMRVRVQACGRHDGSQASEYLAQAVRVKPRFPRTGEGRVLELQHDMIPTIAVLTELMAGPGGVADEEHLLPVILSGSEPAQPTIAVTVPSEMAPILDQVGSREARRWPKLKSAGMRVGHGNPAAGAIRMSNSNKLSDAELFVPVSRLGEGGPGPRDAITWFVEVRHGDDGDLLMALSAAASQDGAVGDKIALIGPASRRSVEHASQVFVGRVVQAKDLGHAIASADTALCGYLGPGVILHDNACTTALSLLLNAGPVATASCVVLSVEPRGRNWHAAIADGGAVVGRDGKPLTLLENIRITEQLWRATYPVTAPSPSFWIAKSSNVRDWQNGKAHQDGEGPLHLCSSAVTASLMANEAASALPDFMPRARNGRAVMAEVLFG